MTTLTPAQIVAELDRYIVGQDRAKRAVAVALRNRWRRQNLPAELRDEVAPKNIIMIGPTGVGKTEVARRLARLAQAPFIKVEASKYTEVGYVGRDVESIIRDLTEISVSMVKAERMAAVQEKAEQLAEERLLDLLLPAGRGSRSPPRRWTSWRLTLPRPARSSAPCCAPAASTTSQWRSTPSNRPCPSSRCSPGRAWKRWGST